MTWFNYYGLIFMALIMIPNIIYAIKNKEGSSKIYKNKVLKSSNKSAGTAVWRWWFSTYPTYALVFGLKPDSSYIYR